MANKGHDLLRSVYSGAGRKNRVIAHGIPDFHLSSLSGKGQPRISRRSVILTLAAVPQQGIEVMIDPCLRS